MLYGGYTPLLLMFLFMVLKRSVALFLVWCVPRYICTGTLLNVSEARHFALSVPLYTHFTSPIRRMADVVVHSLLDAALTDSEPWYTEDEVQRQARVCNERNQAAKKAQEASEKLFMSLYVVSRRLGVRRL